MLQNFEKKNQIIRNAFLKEKKANPKKFERKINLSWSNWGFGIEPLEVSVRRLKKAGIKFIELHGNRYGKDLGYKGKETNKILSDYGIKAAGICGMFSPDNDLSSNRGIIRQNAIDYIRRQIELALEVKANYILIVPGAVGRPIPIDNQEFFRSVESIKIVADDIKEAGIRAAIEPIRSAEVSFCHTFDDALAYIKAVNHPGIQHINGDIYHMLVEESHIAYTIYKKGERLTNLHMADTNRMALGDGSMDFDTIIMALYLLGYNNEKCFATPEPLGPGGDPYPAMFGKPDPAELNELVIKSAKYWNERENFVRNL